MSKKWVRVFLVTMLALSVLIVGCGKTTSDSNEIKIGANVELTGNVANYGQQALSGFQLAIKEANAAGGVNGKQITLVVADNKSEASEAANATTKLITQDKVVALFGPVTSSNFIAAYQVAQDNKIPAVTPSATNAKVTVDDSGKVKPYSFRACFTDSFQGTVMATFAADSLKTKTAAIFVDNSSDYSKSLAEVFEKVFTQNGGQVIAREAYLQKDSDFRAALTKLKAVNPDTIFIPGYYEEVGKIVKQARELGIAVPLLGTDGWTDGKLVEIAGADALNNSYYSNHFSVQDKDASAVNFVKAYQAEYGKEPNVFAALGYDSGLMIIDALKRAETAEPQKIRDALEQTQNFQASTGVLSLDANHNPIKTAFILQRQNGEESFKEKINP
ncbi:ABC transporter substrate-binding protein|uniref:Branched-chain amino acid transport system substrate-binding protein n=1 Tax=Dendrosporobacter quercicolus TaxID=146817 RepID=A0A1G9XXC8_9FIRM|nr:ABC transporter substrate-binding protein [Dendrosporobacter quercicolus]NSL49051.1 ABC transporter substrate-binding protein [Dendrosporobacter quercicolus DSM 1736]SDN01492.1 branched-chain amino acid transport system substrate-binding protein [Dendrosporobacter quercicolus]